MDLRRDVLRSMLFAVLALACIPAAASAAPTWLQPVTLNAAPGYQDAPDVAADSEGNTVAVWLAVDNATNSTRVFASMRPRGGTWGSPRDLEGGSVYPDAPRVTALASGEFVAVWSSSGQARSERQAGCRAVDGVRPPTSPPAAV